MADLEKTVQIIFQGEDSGLSKTTVGIAGKFDNLEATANKISAPLAKAADAVLKVDAALAAMVVGGLALAVRESANFNKGFALISTSVDATGNDLAKYRDQVLDYSKTSVKSMDDINAALYTAAQSGIKWTDSLDFMSKAEQLAVANNANLNTTVDLLTGTMNAYGYSIEDVGHLNDIFFVSTLIGKQTIDDLGQSMGQVVGIAANFGVSFEELSMAIATLTAKGMQTPEAITAIKGVITSIISPSKEAADAARALGLDFSASSLKAQGFGGILTNIMNATGGSADKMAVLFNEVRSLNGAMQLTGDGMKLFTDAMNEAERASGKNEAAYKKMVEVFSNQSQMLVNTAKVMLVDVGTKLEPVAAGIAGSFAQVLSGIDAGVKAGAFDPLFDMLEKAGNEISIWLASIAKALPDALNKLDFSGLITAVQSFGKEITNAFSGKEVSPDKLAQSIQFVVDTIASLIDVSKGIGEGLAPFAEAIKIIVDGFNKLSPDIKETLGQTLGIAYGFQKLGPIWGAVMLGMAIDSETASQLITLAFYAIENGVNALKVATISLGLVFASASYEMAKLLDYVPGYDASEDIKRTSERVKILTDVLSDAEDKYNKSAQKLLTTGSAADQLGKSASDAASKTDTLNKSLSGLPGEVKTTAHVTVNDAEIDAWKSKMNSSGAVNVPVKPTMDQVSLQDTENILYGKFGGGQTIRITTNLDGSSTIETVGKLNTAIPKEQKVDIKPDITQTALAEIKEKSSIIQKSIEWKAKIDLAQIEAATKIMEVAFKSVDAAIEGTGKTLTGFTDNYSTLINQGKGGTAFMEQLIMEESRRRDEAMRMQKDLVGAQVENLNARTEAMRQGQAMIQIDGKGLQPQLEAFMFEILKAIQVRANAEGAQYLVGI